MASSKPVSGKLSDVIRKLSDNPKAIQKRKNRYLLREKRRRSYFVHDYIRTKYPDMFNEANGMYQVFVEKYPTKPDFCKTYYFRKWQKEIDESRQRIMIPHLPILTSPNNLRKYQATTHEQTTDEQGSDEPGECEEVNETGVQSTVEIQESSQFQQMSLDEIDRAVKEIVSSLREDQELKDMVPEIDLPDDVWEKELSIPDYLLEDELNW